MAKKKGKQTARRGRSWPKSRWPRSPNYHALIAEHELADLAEQKDR